MAEVLALNTSHLSPEQSILLIDDVEHHLHKKLSSQGLEQLTHWSRFAFENHSGTPWPVVTAPVDVVLMRLPRAKDVLEMNLHAAASCMKPGAELIVCGANDEGAKSAQKRIAQVFSQVSTRDTRKHCRVISAAGYDPEAIKASLTDWLDELPSPLHDVERPWHHYPGLFARGKLDDATALLIHTLPELEPNRRVLDFAAGGGVISAALLAKEPTLDLVMLDADALAIEAARVNVQGASRVHCSDAWHGLPHSCSQFDLIVSNPPIHRGKIEDFAALKALVSGAPERLARGGSLWMVVQRQVPVTELFESWHEVTIPHHNNRFNIWHAIHSPL